MIGDEEGNSKFRSGVNWSFIAVAGRHAIQFLSTAVLARLLLPEQFGLAAMVGTLMNFLTLFLDLGLSWFTIQKEKLGAREISNLFWINTAMGVAVGLVCFAVSPAVAGFYRHSDLAPYFYLQSLTFIFFGAAIQPSAVMKREMRFRELTLCEVASQLFSTTLSIGMAANGYGLISLILPQVATHALRAGLMFWRSRIRLFMPSADGQLRTYFRVGGSVTASGFFFYFARNLDDILTGRVFGAAAMGFYSRAYLVANLPSQLPAKSLSHVVISAISRQREDKNANWYESYRKILIGLSFVVSPLAAGLALTAPEVVRLVYGDKWSAVAPLLFWLALASVFQPAYNSVGWLLVSLARYRAYFWWSLISAIFLAGGFSIATFFDLEAMAISYFLIGGLLLCLPSQYIAHRINGLPFRRAGADLGKIYVCVALMAAALWALRQWPGLNDAHYLARLALYVSTGIAVYYASARLLFEKLPVDVAAWLRGRSA